MFNTYCVCRGNCKEFECSGACPVAAQVMYLMERNEISFPNAVTEMPVAKVRKYQSLLKDCKGSVKTFITYGSTSKVADEVTYTSIFNYWKGSVLHCVVYNLKFSKYLDVIQRGWNSPSVAENAEQIKIWATSAKVLVISGLDFVNFKDFQTQTLLALIQERRKPDLTTIIVTPPPSSLIGTGALFFKLTDVLNSNKVVLES